MSLESMRQPDVHETVSWVVRGRNRSLIMLLRNGESQGWQSGEIHQTSYDGHLGHIVMRHQDEPLLSKTEREWLLKKYGLNGFYGRIVYDPDKPEQEYVFLVPDFKGLKLPNEAFLRPLLVPLQ